MAAVLHQVPDPEHVRQAISALGQQDPLPTNLVGWLIAAARTDMDRAVRRASAEIELDMAGVPRELRDAICETSARLGKSHRALLAWARKKLAQGDPGRTQTVPHVLRLASSGEDAWLDRALSIADWWYGAYRKLPKKLEWPSDEALLRITRGELDPDKAWEV